MKTSLFSNPLNSFDLKNRKIPSVRDHVLRGFSRGTYGLLIADEGVGKSGLAHLIATDLAAGLNMSGLTPIHGKVMIISLEDRELDWSTRQRAIDQDLTQEQLELVKKNMQVHDLKEYTNSLSNKVVYEDLLEAGRNFKPDLIIIDYLDKWAENDLIDVMQAKNITKSIEELALKLNCCILFLHHTNKGNGDENRSTRDKTSGAIQYQRNTKWRGILEKNRKSKNKNDYTLFVEKARCSDYKLEYMRRDDRCGIPYSKLKKDGIKEFKDDCVDLNRIGGEYKKVGLVPMSVGLLKHDGVFASFTSNQSRPKLDVKVTFEKNRWLHIYGPDMLGPAEAKILLAIVAKLNSDGIRICLPNHALNYENLIDKIEEHSSFSMEVETSLHELYCFIKGKHKPCPNAYNSIKMSLKRLQTATVFFQNREKEYGLSLIDFFVINKINNKMCLRLNPFLVESILGIGGVSFTLIPIKILKDLSYDPSLILYQRIKSIVRKNDKNGVIFKIDTLLGYLYPFECKSYSMRKERLKSLRKAIKELEEKTEISFIKESKSSWIIKLK